MSRKATMPGLAAGAAGALAVVGRVRLDLVRGTAGVAGARSGTGGALAGDGEGAGGEDAEVLVHGGDAGAPHGVGSPAGTPLGTTKGASQVPSRSTGERGRGGGAAVGGDELEEEAVGAGDAVGQEAAGAGDLDGGAGVALGDRDGQGRLTLALGCRARRGGRWRGRLAPTRAASRVVEESSAHDQQSDGRRVL